MSLPSKKEEKRKEREINIGLDSVGLDGWGRTNQVAILISDIIKPIDAQTNATSRVYDKHKHETSQGMRREEPSKKKM